jgi:DNA-binding SARP family transcriptional activator
MLALYHCGRQAHALAAFHDLRATLADELGIDPSPPMRDLYQAMLRAGPESRGLAPTTTPAKITA